MKDEATPEQLAMARRVINENSNYMQGLDRGQCYFSAQEVMQITLAAIIETQRLDAELADGHGLEGSDEALTADCIATAIRAGKHYGKDQQ